MTVSIVIPNYNGEQLLKKNLPKVVEAVKSFSAKRNTVEIIIVDDASKDNSVPFIKSLITKYKKSKVHIILLENRKNLGFSSTVNRGVRSAAGSIVVLMNTDVNPQTGFLEKVVPHFTDMQVFAVGFLDKSIEGKSVVERGRGIGTWKRGFLQHAAGDIEGRNTLWASGGSSAFRKSMWDRLKGMYEIYNPFYWEDIDLSYRALKAGYRIHFDPSIIVTHEHEKGAIRSHFSSQKIKQIAYRNQLLFVWINITDTSFVIQGYLWLVFHVMSALLHRDMAFVYGLLDACKRYSSMRELRNRNKKVFKISDKAVLKNFEK